MKQSCFFTFNFLLSHFQGYNH